MIEVYVVDDHPFVREGLKAFLRTQGDIKLVGEAGSGEKALPEILALKPQVIIVDLHLPGIGGVELTRKIKAQQNDAKIIILSSYSEEEEVIEAIEAGALSYLLKDSAPLKLAEAIQAAGRGEPVLHPKIAKKLMRKVSEPKSCDYELTAKEMEVLALLAQGRSNKEIAASLFVSETTIKTHVSNILRKLDVNDRTQAAIKALREGLAEI